MKETKDMARKIKFAMKMRDDVEMCIRDSL